MRVVCISAECEPWAKTGGLGDVVDALARALGVVGMAAGRPQQHLQSQQWTGTGAVMGDRPGRGASRVARPDAAVDTAGVDTAGVEWTAEGGDPIVEPPVDVFLPRYRAIPVPADATVRPLRVPDPLAADGLTDLRLVEFDARGYRVRLVDHPPAFDRDGYYGDAKGDYPDNAWRFGLLCRAALEALKQDDRPFDLMHLHDWQATPAVLYRDAAYDHDPRIAMAAAMVTIHNLAYQGWQPRSALPGLAFPHELERLVKPGADGLLLLRAGIERAELVNTVSPGYAGEILTPDFGMGMEEVLGGLGHRFGGILNGLDMAVWDPATDDALPARYSAGDMAGKAASRRALLEEIGFDGADDSPLLGMIGRLDPQKGFDLLAEATPALVAEGARVVALGTGQPNLVRELRRIAEKRPRSVAVVERFDRALARRIYAGADFFVMPSRFEPCGQGQMISMRYGTPPIVHRTGGLADTVVDLDDSPDEGTGFVFDEATPEALVEASRRAITRRRHGGAPWKKLVARGMAIDWSWEAGPAEQYQASYRRAISLRRER